MTYHIDPQASEQSGCLVIQVINKPTLKIPYSQAISTLKELAGTGQLHFNQRALVCDFYSPTEFYYRVDQNTIQGRLKSHDKDFPIQECDFLCNGTPPWYIKGIFLKLIQTNVSWNDLKKAKMGKTSQEDLDDADGPKVVYSGEKPAPTTREPLPLLILKDRSGAFADLWMDYGEGERFALHDPQAHHTRIPALEAAWEKDLLETSFIKKNVGTTHYFCPLDKVAKSLAFLLEIGWTIHDWQGRRVIHNGKADLTVDSKQDILLVKGKIKFQDYDADITQVVGAFNRRERFLQLSQQAVALLPEQLDTFGIESLQGEGEVIGDAIAIPKSRFALLDNLSEGSLVLSQLRDRLQNFQSATEAPPHASFLGTLRPYQQQGVNWLQCLYDNHLHGLLADDMGLGKTVQVIAFLSRLTLENPVLIVLPTSLLFNWKRELEQFLPSMPVILHHGAQRSNHPTDLQKPAVILTTYSTLRLDFLFLSTLVYQCVFLDEAQAIKNAHTQTAQAVFRLHARFRLSLSGTPIENHLNELWSQFRFLIPDLFGEEKAFEADLQASSADNRYLKKIQKKIRPFVLRRKKEEVAKDLPEKIEQVVWVEMDESQRQVYDSFLAGVRGGLLKKVQSDGLSKHRLEVLEAILRLRQICCDPLLVSSHRDDDTLCGSAKLDTLLQDIDTAIEEGRKILVYSQFTTMLSLIAKRLREKAIVFVSLDGSTQNREKVVLQFQEDDTIPLFLISLKAGGIGLNLTAADYVFLYDPWWNEAIENQAIDRAHRIGRRDTVIAKRYIMVESIEEKMMKLKAHKRALVEGLLDDTLDNGALTEQDFYYLIS